MKKLILEDKIKKLIKRNEAEIKEEQIQYDNNPNEDNFSEGYIRAIELQNQYLEELLK